MIDTKMLLNNFWETKNRIIDANTNYYYLCYRELVGDYIIEVSIRRQESNEAYIKTAIITSNEEKIFNFRDIVDTIHCVVNYVGINVMI